MYTLITLTVVQMLQNSISRNQSILKMYSTNILMHTQNSSFQSIKKVQPINTFNLQKNIQPLKGINAWKTFKIKRHSTYEKHLTYKNYLTRKKLTVNNLLEKFNPLKTFDFRKPFKVFELQLLTIFFRSDTFRGGIYFSSPKKSYISILWHEKLCDPINSRQRTLFCNSLVFMLLTLKVTTKKIPFSTLW